MDAKYYIFDYGATIDTPGTHWGKLMWHAYEAAMERPGAEGASLTEERFREAYVYAERYLGSHEVIKPTDTFHTTLQKKIELQLSHLAEASPIHPTFEPSWLLEWLYERAKANVAESKAVLEELKRRGKTLGVVSNFYGNIQAVLDEFGLTSLFTAVVESATEGIRKPDPRLLGLCIERLTNGHTPPPEGWGAHTVVIGDHLTKDIQPAKQLGCTAVWIKGEPWSNEHDALDCVQPDHTITCLRELALN